MFFFIGELSQKFDLENVILTNTKDFSWEKRVQICQISRRFFFEVVIFLQYVPVGSQEYRRILVLF
jgi:hypothetical protein